MSSFRWVVLELDIFLPKSRRQGQDLYIGSDFETMLVTLETSRAPAVDRLFLAYRQVYNDAIGIGEMRKHLVVSIMSWVLCSFRQLSLSDLVSLLSAELQQPNLTKGNVLLICSNLIVETSLGLVRIAHLSVRQFFEDHLMDESVGFNPSHQHLRVAISCIGNLNLPNAAMKLYSAQYWSIHSRNATPSLELDELLRHVPGSDSPLDVTHQLVASRGPLDLRDTLGNTSLHNAILRRDKKQVQLLLDVDLVFHRPSHLCKVPNFSGDLPIHVAASRGFTEILGLLLRADSGLTTKNEWGLTPLHDAVIHSQEGFVAEALRLKAGLKVLDKRGGTLLHTATFCKNASITKLLLSSGFDPELKNEDGDTPRDVAQRRDPRHVARIFDTHDPAGEQENYNERPSIQIAESNLCSYCNVQLWIEGSRNGLSYPHWASLEELERSAKNSCPLCQLILDSVQKDTDVQETTGDQVSIQATVAIAADARRRSQPRDVLSISVDSRDILELEFCIDGHGNVFHTTFVDNVLILGAESASSDASELPFRGRTIQGDAPISLLREWLQSCDHDHEDCRYMEHPDRWPTRLIDIGLGDPEAAFRPRLVEHLKPDSRGYVFLSYLWGNIPFLQLTLLNRAKHLEHGIDLDELPPLFQDVFFLCRRLGYQYLWIDALCINQTLSEDWEIEATRMSDYILNASYVIASHTRSPMQNLWPSTVEHVLTLEASLPGGNSGFSLHLRDSLSTAKSSMFTNVLSRAWRAQEALLARRMVMIGDDQVFWNCASCLKAQGRVGADFPVFTPLASLEAQADEHNYALDRSYLSHIRDAWYGYVEMVTFGQLTRYDDRLPSATGIMRAVQRILHSEASHGLWVSDIAHGLLWLPVPHEGESRSDMRFYEPKEPQPSWSWASIIAPVSYCLRSTAGTEPMSEEVLSKCALAIGKYQRATLGFRWGETIHVTVDGLVYRLTSETILNPCDYFLDKGQIVEVLDSGEVLSLLLLTPSGYTSAGTDLRWMGLIVREVPGESWERVGVFLGPDCNDELKGWKMAKLSVV